MGGAHICGAQLGGGHAGGAQAGVGRGGDRMAPITAAGMPMQVPQMLVQAPNIPPQKAKGEEGAHG